MLKVLLVDDEPFIVQGLSALVDWQSAGFEIVGTAANGLEAVTYLKEQQVDLIIADIKMPEMTGLELLKYIRDRHLSEAFFVILSGYSDFAYAKEAICYHCTDYILKPVQKEQLLDLLSRVTELYEEKQSRKQTVDKMGKAYFIRHVQNLILGRAEAESVAYVENKIPFEGSIRYIDIEIEDVNQQYSLEEKRQIQRKVYENCMQLLGEQNQLLVFMDAAGKEDLFDIGFIYHTGLMVGSKISEEEYFHKFLTNINTGITASIVMYVGGAVEQVADIGASYRTAVVAKSFQNFKMSSEICFYTESMQNPTISMVTKKSMEQLLRAVEENDKVGMQEAVDAVYAEMNEGGMDAELIQMNMNYLLLQLVQLAIQQDQSNDNMSIATDGNVNKSCNSSVNQEEIIQYIRENAFDTHTVRGSKCHFEKFVEEYAEYLCQIRKHLSKGVLQDIERDIKANYAQNITLKELGKKYFINSAYLGQLFRKQYGMSFKDYLNTYRIEKAAELLLRTDKKIYYVAEQVGYHDLDYFINKFISLKGCTPTSFRKRVRVS